MQRDNALRLLVQADAKIGVDYGNCAVAGQGAANDCQDDEATNRGQSNDTGVDACAG